MPFTINYGRPGVGSALTATTGRVFRAEEGKEYFPHGGTIDGTKSRYYGGGSAAQLFTLPSGLLVGQITASKKWAPTVLGISANAYTAGGTSITVTAAQAAYIVSRVGTTGNLYYVGPPAAAGTVATLGPIAYSAINTSTGVITTATLGANLIAGGLVVAGDGSEIPRTVIDDGHGITVPSDSTDCDFPRIPRQGCLDVAKILDYPTDTALIAWVKDKMCANGRCLFTFSDELAAA